MKRLTALMLLAACGGGGEGQPADSTAVDSVAMTEATRPLAMPEAPSGVRGQLAARSDGELNLGGAWRARAGLCATPPMLQLLVQEEYDGIILLLALPSDGSRITTYPVTIVDAGIPAGPAAQAAVQRIIENRPYGWQADSGAVEIYAWDGDRLSGRFGLALRNIATNERSLLAGSFLGIDVVRLAPEQCQVEEPAG